MAQPPFAPGLHLLLDLYGATHLDAVAELEAVLRRAAERAGATVIASHFKHFGGGGGVTGVVLLAESHISIHTWPEIGFAAVDIFMCGASHPDLARQEIEAALRPIRTCLSRIARGTDHLNQASHPAL
jgi:S-adenosylmethionine decarboxylase